MRLSRRLWLPLVAVAAALVAAAGPALAMHATGAGDPWSFRAGDAGNFFSVGASVGMVEGSCSEKVFTYPLGKKFLLSDLKWDYQDVTFGGVMASAGMGGRYRVNIGYWAAFRGGSGLMVDRDWVYDEDTAQSVDPDDTNWTDASRHPDTSLDGGTMLDVNVSFLSARQASPFSLRAILGLKRDTWDWSARGGTYVYSTAEFRDSAVSTAGFRDSTGEFESGRQVIKYQQEYAIPYLGVGANWSTPRFLLDMHALVSATVWATTKDYHNLRDVTFAGDFFGGRYVGLGLTATYAITPRWAVTVRGEYQSIADLTGDLTMTTPEGRTVYPGACGVAMDALMYSLGTSFRF